MMKQIRNKNAEIRKNIRRQQIQDYFKQRRQEIFQSAQNGQPNEKFNQQVKEHMTKGNTQEIYNILYKTDSLKYLNMLSKSICFDLIRFLALHITNLQCVLLLKSLIDVRYNTIFLDKQQQNASIELVYLLFKMIDDKAVQLSNLSNQLQKKSCMKIINGYLDCLRSFIFNRLEKEDDFSFDVVYKVEMIQKLWYYLKLFHTSPIYLSILALSEMEFGMTTIPQFKQFVRSNSDAFLAITNQIDLKNSEPLVLSSVVLMNSVFTNMQDDKEFIIFLLPSYLQKTKIIYSKSQQKDTKVVNVIHFYDMMENIASVFKLAQQQILNCHLGQLMSKTNFWTFAFVLLRIEISNVRISMYQIIRSSIKNILANKASLNDYITESLVSFVVEGLESEFSSITIQSLNILQYLLQDGYNLSQKLLILLPQYQISSSLENIEYSSNTQMAKMATSLINTLEKINQRDEMIAEE